MIKVDSRFEEITRKYSPSAPATPSKGSSSTGAAPATITAESSRRRFEEITAKYAVSTPKVTQPDVKTPAVTTPTVDYQSYLETLDIDATDKRIRELEQQIRAAKAADSTVPMQGIADNRSWEEIYAESEAKAAKIRPLEKELQQLKNDRERARAAQYDKKGSEKLSTLDTDTLSLLDALRPKQETPTVEMQGVADNRSWEERYAQSEAVYAQARAALRQKGYTDSEITELVKHRQRQANRQNYDAEVAKSAKEAAERPGAASLKSVPQNLTGGLGYLSLVAQKANRALTGSDTPLDYYTPEMVGQAKAQTTRETVSSQLGTVGAFLYNTGMSMADSTAIALMTMAGVPAGVGTTLLGGSAATAATVEAKERGVSDEQALMTGLSAGIAEGVFEKLSLDKLLQTKPAVGTLRQTLKQTVRNMGIQGTVEGSEELATSVANTLADAIINGDHSAYQKNLQTYLITGHSAEEARKLANRDWLKGIAGDFLGGLLSGGVMGGAGSFISRGRAGADAASASRSEPSGEKTSTVTPEELRGAQSATAAQEKPKRDALMNAMFGAETQNTAASEETTANSRLTPTDLDDYMQVGARQHVRNQKAEMTARGESPILTKAAEVVDFIRRSFSGEIRNTIKAYGRVGTRFAEKVHAATNGGVDIGNYYLELDSNMIAHIGDHVETDKDSRNIPLTVEQLEQLPEYIDTFDDLLDVIRRKDGSVRLMLGKKINGHSIIIEAVSKGRQALHPITAYQVDTAYYEQNYKPKAVDRSSTSQPASADHVDISRPATTFGDTVSQNEQVVNSADATNTVGAAAQGFDPFTAAQNEYGTLPSGENPVRPDDVPVSTNGTDRVSQTVVTVKGAKVTPDAFVPLVENETMKGRFSFIPITNDATVQKAEAKIMEDGWEKAKVDWVAKVRQGKTGADVTAMGALLYNNAVNAGQEQEALDILADYQLAVRNSARGLQAAGILKTLTPENRLYMMERSIQSMADRMGLENPITLPQGMKDAYLNAGTEKARNDAVTEIQKYVAQKIPPTLKDMWTALRYINMLGNAKTQVRNVAGNVGMTAVSEVRNAVATGLEMLANIVTGGKAERTRTVLPGRDLMQAAKADFAEVSSAAMGADKYSEGALSESEFARGVQEQRTIFRGVLAPLEGIRKATDWAMNNGLFGDKAFSRGAYARTLARYLKAKNVTAQQWNDADWQKANSKFVSEARDFAIREAQEATFRDSNALSEWVSRIGRRADTPKAVRAAAEGIMPFRKTPANILVRAEEYSPLGLINNAVAVARKAKGADISSSDIINGLAKTLTGTGIFVLGMWLRSEGLLRGGDDEDEKQAAFDDLTGHQAYSLELEDGTSITLDWLTPASMPLFMGVQLMDLIHDEGFELKDLEQALTSIAEPMLQMSMLQGVSDTLSDLQYSQSNNLLQTAGAAALGYLTQGLTNSLVGQLERTQDGGNSTTYVDPKSAIPAWLQREIGAASRKVPGWDYNQIPYIDAWGREEETGDVMVRAVNNLFNPAYVSEVDVDAVERELQRLYDATGTGSVLPNRADKSFTVNKETRYLTAEEYVKYAKAKGQNSYRYVSQAVNSAAYRTMSDEAKAELLSSLYGYANYKAKKAVVPSYESDTYRKCAEAEAAGVSPAAYYAMRGEYDYDGNGNITQAEAQRYLDGQRDLTENQKADLWTIINSSWKKNPYA